MIRPINVRQERFCEFVAAGESQTDAYIKAGFKADRTNARKHAAALMTKHDISARVAELRKPQTKAALRKKEDNLRFLASIIETPLSQIDPGSPLCAEYTEEIIAGGCCGKLKRGKSDRGNEVVEETVIRRKIKKPDPLRAIEIYSRLLGHFEPDRTEIDVEQRSLQSIKERAATVVSTLVNRYRTAEPL